MKATSNKNISLGCDGFPELPLINKLNNMNQFQVNLVGDSLNDSLEPGRGDVLKKAINDAFSTENLDYNKTVTLATKDCQNAIELYAVASFLGKKQTSDAGSLESAISRLLNLTKQ